jgi:hypothetical protein
MYLGGRRAGIRQGAETVQAYLLLGLLGRSGASEVSAPLLKNLPITVTAKSEAHTSVERPGILENDQLFHVFGSQVGVLQRILNSGDGINMIWYHFGVIHPEVKG